MLERARIEDNHVEQLWLSVKAATKTTGVMYRIPRANGISWLNSVMKFAKRSRGCIFGDFNCLHINWSCLILVGPASETEIPLLEMVNEAPIVQHAAQPTRTADSAEQYSTIYLSPTPDSEVFDIPDRTESGIIIAYEDVENTLSRLIDWKQSIITQRYKGGDRFLPQNYRPVSLTSLCDLVVKLNEEIERLGKIAEQAENFAKAIQVFFANVNFAVTIEIVFCPLRTL
ncbi:unnamed protein product [Dibothriocephalus latus]|uniref:Uncharacterized protein n=1 Tax=Dibothriocephalus latus TaxID=60516 RepID=A0A3P7NY58_DIBLA|nr:unnamed protein product [Dibothriocephalus latus]